jgi:MFS family permease
MLRDWEIRRLGLARLVSVAGAEAAFFVGIWGRAAFELDASAGQLALVVAVMGAGNLIGSVLGGLLVDRFGPRRVLLVGELVVIPSTLALILPSTLGQLTVAVALAGMASLVVHTAVTAFPAVLTSDPERLGRANAALEFASTGAFVVGPAAGAATAAIAGVDAVFVLDAVTSLLAVALCLALPERVAARSGERLSWREVTAGVSFAYRRPRIRFVLSIGMLTWLSFGVFGALEPLFFREVLGSGPTTLGWVNSVFGLGLAIGTLLLGRAPARLGTLPVATLLAAGGGLGAVVYTGTASLAVVVVGAVGWGLVLGLLLPTLRTLVQLEVPPALVGRAMGAYQVHEHAGDLLPLVLAPPLAAAFGVQATLVGTGVVVFVLALALLPAGAGLERDHRRRRSEAGLPEVAGHEATGAVVPG